MAKRPSLSGAVKPPTPAERAQEAARVAKGIGGGSTPHASPQAPAPGEVGPLRTVSYHVPDDLASLVEDLADARFRKMRAEREAVMRAGGKWEGGRVRRSASGVASEALEAFRETMARELREIEVELGK